MVGLKKKKKKCISDSGQGAGPNVDLGRSLGTPVLYNLQKGDWMKVEHIFINEVNQSVFKLEFPVDV